MKCFNCKGEGQIFIGYNEDKKILQKCGDCKGSGLATKEQELEYNLNNMKLHEEITINGATYVLKVMGGWLYQFYDNQTDTVTSSVFVKK